MPKELQNTIRFDDDKIEKYEVFQTDNSTYF